MKDARARAMLTAAAAILVIALVWLVILETKSPVRALCTRLKEYGYNIAPGDLYLQGYGSDTSIRGLLSGDGISDEEIARLVTFSRQKGFDADIDKTGKVQLYMYEQSDGKVLLVYMVDDVPELVFTEAVEGGEVSPIG